MAEKITRNDLHKILEEIKNSEALPDNLSTEAQLWDEALKKEVFVMPEQVFPLIQELYGKHYDKGTPIEPLATEFSVERADTRKISSIRADITLLIAKKDIYHFECQLEHDGTMVLRMFEYDVHVALSYPATIPGDESRDSQYSLNFPHSAVLYLQDNQNTPDFLQCKIHFQDGGEYLYRIPTLKIQSYSLTDIEDKHLTLLTPFLPLRFRKKMVKDKDTGKISFHLSKEELTSFYQELILILDRETAAGRLTEHKRSTILSLLRKSMYRVFYQDEELIKEVVKMTEPILELEIEKYIHASIEAEERYQQAYQRFENANLALEQTSLELEQTNQELEQTNQELEQASLELEQASLELSRYKEESTQKDALILSLQKQLEELKKKPSS